MWPVGQHQLHQRVGRPPSHVTVITELLIVITTINICQYLFYPSKSIDTICRHRQYRVAAPKGIAIIDIKYQRLFYCIIVNVTTSFPTFFILLFMTLYHCQLIISLQFTRVM